MIMGHRESDTMLRRHYTRAVQDMLVTGLRLHDPLPNGSELTPYMKVTVTILSNAVFILSLLLTCLLFCNPGTIQ